MKNAIWPRINLAIFSCILFGLAFTTQLITAEEEDLTCTKLQSEGGETTVECHHNGKVTTDCSTKNSEPGSQANYNCVGKNGEKFSGVLNCTFGVWQSILNLGNSSLCNLGGQILNIVFPDFLRMSGKLRFDVPEVPKNTHDDHTEEQHLALELHNKLRSKHQAPPLDIQQQLNEAADKAVKKLTHAFNVDADDQAENLKNLKKSQMGVTNMETNIYRQSPANKDIKDLIGQALMSWYTVGERSYDWNNIENNLGKTTSVMFSRMVWKSTTAMGLATGDYNDTSFVVCIYTPGRNVVTTDIIADFKENVLPAPA